MRGLAQRRLGDGLGGCRDVVVPQHQGRPFEDPAAAPIGTVVQVKVRDALGDYILPFGCERTQAGGWINADLGTALGAGIRVVGWRRRDFR
jgi:hypothetical protein